MWSLPNALPTQSALLITIAMSSTGASQVLLEEPLLALGAVLMAHAQLASIAMSSSSALMASLLPSSMRNQPDALPTQSALLTTTAMNSTGASQVLLEGPMLVLDAVLMAHAPLANIAMSSSSALMAHLRPSFSE